MIDPDVVREIADLMGLAGLVAGWFYVRRLRKRLGCRDDWELIALAYRKAKERFGRTETSKNSK